MTEPIAFQTSDPAIDTTPTPYPPSWLDRLGRWVDRLPIPAWFFYTLIGLFGAAGYATLEWHEGQYPTETFYPLHVFLPFGVSYLLVLTYYLDRYAGAAFDRFRPALIEDSEQQEALLRFQLTTLPARPTFYATIIGVGVASLTFLAPSTQRAQLYNYADTPLSGFVHTTLWILIWVVGGAFIYHEIHQLRIINLIYTKHTRINLYQLRPLYALMRLSWINAIGIGIYAIAGLAVTPTSASGTAAVTQAIGVLPAPILPFMVFLSPLWGIHRLLAAEKGRLLDNNQAAIEHIVNEVHQRVRAQPRDDIDYLQKLLNALETEARLLKGIPTWPWPTDTLRSVIATLLFPFSIWLLQQFLLRFVL